MIQDIYPSRLKNEYIPYEMRNEDSIFIFDEEGKILVKDNEGKMEFPIAGDMGGVYIKPTVNEDSTEENAKKENTKEENTKEENTKEEVDIKCEQRVIYLFSLDDRRFFLDLVTGGGAKEKEDGEAVPDGADDGLIKDGKNNASGYKYYSIREIRDDFSGKEVYAAFTAFHLWRWYADNKFCGRCGGKTEPDKKERAMRCPECGNMIFPRINPAVIVGVTKGDQILITKYRSGFAHNALVAGFTEIGETLEETVAREVMEETGVKVKNIRYYKSQPWGMAQDILAGFYCEADGDGEIHMDRNELKYAEWVKREDIILQPNNLSLTNEMMKRFMDGKEREF